VDFSLKVKIQINSTNGMRSIWVLLNLLLVNYLVAGGRMQFHRFIMLNPKTQSSLRVINNGMLILQ